MYYNLMQVLSEIQDPRRKSQIDYSLPQIFGLVIISVLCGVKHLLHIEYFCKAQLAWFKKVLGINKAPSDSTISRVLESVSCVELEAAITLWAEQIFKDKHMKSRIVIDSKKIGNGLMLTRALLLGVRQVIGSSKFIKHESEIKNISKLIKKLYIKEFLISIDAIGTHAEIADLITSKLGSFLLPVKGNQKTLNEDLKLFCQSEKPASIHETKEINRGRIEVRKVYAFNDVIWLRERHSNWKNINSFCLIETYRKEKNKRASTTYRIYISSEVMNAERFLFEIRSHWDIENKLHWPLNQAFSENKNLLQNFNATVNLSTILSTAVTLLSKFKLPKISFNLQKLMLSWDLTPIEKLLGLGA